MSQGFDPYGAWLGIPPDQRPPHAYALLGLAPGEGNAYAISAAADRAAGRLRILLGGPQAATAAQLLNEIEGARQMLLDPAQKARYDAQLRQPSGDSAYRPAPRPGMAGPLPTGPLPSAPNYGYGSQPATPAPGWGMTPSPAPGSGWSMPAPPPPAGYPQQPYSPYAQQPGYPAPAASYPSYPQPAAAPYYPTAYPTPAYQPAPAYAPPSYPAAAPPPVAEAPAPAKPPEETPDFSAPAVASRPSSADAMFWPWMLIGAGAVLAMGLALVWLMQQQNPPPAPPVARNPPPAARKNPIAPLPPLRQLKPGERFLESQQKKIGDGDGEGPIPIPGVTQSVGDPAPAAAPTAVAAMPASVASIAGLAEAANAKIASPPMTPGMPPTVAATGNMNPMPMPMTMPPAATDPMKPMVAATDPMMKPMPAPLPGDPMKPAAVALADIPPAVELPAYDENAPAGSAGGTPVRLGPVHLAEKQKLELALLDAEAAAAQPGARFALSQAGTTDAKPSWQAEYIDEANKPTPLGRFTYEDQALRFAWLAGADPQKAQRFRNVRLAMMVASERHTSALRKPVETPQFTLNLDGIAAKHVVSGLPDADDLGLEIIDQTATGPEHKIEPAAKVPAGKETDIVFATAGEKPTKLRFRFLLARPGPNSLRIDGRVLVDSGKPQAFRLDTLKQNLELTRKQKIALEGEFLDFQQKGGRQNRQAYQAAEAVHRQRSDELTSRINSLDEFIKLCDEVNQKATFQYRVFMKLSDAEVDLVRGTTAMAK